MRDPLEAFAYRTLATCSSFVNERRLLEDIFNTHLFLKSGEPPPLNDLIVWEPGCENVVEHLWTMGEIWGDPNVDWLSWYLWEYESLVKRWRRARHGLVKAWLLGDEFRPYKKRLRRHVDTCAAPLAQGKAGMDEVARSEIADNAYDVIRLTWHSLRYSRAEDVPWLVLSACMLLEGHAVIDIIEYEEGKRLMVY